IEGSAGATVNYTVSDGVNTSGGSTTIGPNGMTGLLLDLSGFNDGVITVSATQTIGGAAKSLGTGRTGKSSIVPGAPVLSLAQYISPTNMAAYAIRITGAPGTFAIFGIADARGLQNADSDIIPTSGVLDETLDASWSLDGPIAVLSALYNGNGNSAATVVGVTKDTVAPVLQPSTQPYVNLGNAGDYQPLLIGEPGASAAYTITDGSTTLSDSKPMNASGKWQPSITLTSLKDGPLTLTVTETDPAGNTTVVVVNLVKDTSAPTGTFSVAASLINGVLATSNPTLALTLSFADKGTGMAAMALSADGGTTFGTPSNYATTASLTLAADGISVVMVAVADVAGNVSAVSRSVRLDRSGPSVGYSITAPSNAGSYDVGQKVALSFTASDVDNVATVSATLDGSTSIAGGSTFNTEALTAGNHSIVISARDALGNTSTTTIAFAVHATADGLATAVSDGASRRLITSSNVASQLQSYISSAQKAIQSGKNAQAKTYLASLVALVQQQSGKTISSAYAALLVGWANDLIGRL
ncbi:MAG TPA: hypothetical protein VI172_11670, partial [Candidatus Dormibacteraeota bacterium]